MKSIPYSLCICGWEGHTENENCPECNEDLYLLDRNEMKFELGKYYKHTTGSTLYICGVAETKMWGRSLIAEVGGEARMIAVGDDLDSASNYHEITEAQFMEDYS